MIQKLLNDKRVLIGLFFVIGFSIIALLLAGGGNKGTGGDYAPDQKKAYFVDSTEVYTSLGSRRFSYLQDDLRSHFDDLIKDDDKPVNFSVSSVVAKDDSVVIEGKYKRGVGKTKIEVKLLNNERLDVTMSSDKKTNHDILPSNSKINIYIAKLPIITPEYSIEFLLIDNSIAITLYSGNPDLGVRAKQTIIDAVGAEEANKQTITITFPLNDDSGAGSDEAGIADEGYR